MNKKTHSIIDELSSLINLISRTNKKYPEIESIISENLNEQSQKELYLKIINLLADEVKLLTELEILNQENNRHNIIEKKIDLTGKNDEELYVN